MIFLPEFHAIPWLHLDIIVFEGGCSCGSQTLCKLNRECERWTIVSSRFASENSTDSDDNVEWNEDRSDNLDDNEVIAKITPKRLLKRNKSRYNEISSDIEEDNDILSSPINITPPPTFQYSPIRNEHLEKAKQILARSKKPVQERGQKRVKCGTCDKTFLRISTHKCKGENRNFI